jgi:hypothetical protein
VNLHVLTAVTRPRNLERVYDSIYSVEHPSWRVFWHILHLSNPFVGGQVVKNYLLDETPGGWVYVLDDDTIMHPEFLGRTAETIELHPDADVIFFARIDRGTTWAPEIAVGSVDIGQALMRRELIADLRIPDLYEGDGQFLEKVLDRAKESVYLSDPLCFYNLLNP